MDYLTTAQTVLQLVQQHWQTVVLLATFAGGAVSLLKNKAYAEFAALALTTVEQVAVTEMDSADKRKAAVDDAYKLAPVWVAKLVSEEQAVQIVENAYDLLKHQLPAK